MLAAVLSNLAGHEPALALRSQVLAKHGNALSCLNRFWTENGLGHENQSMVAQTGIAGVEHVTQRATCLSQGLSALVRHETIENNNKPYSRDQLYPSIFNQILAKKGCMGLE